MAAGGECERAASRDATAAIKQAKTTNGATINRGAEPIRRTAAVAIERSGYVLAARACYRKLETPVALDSGDDAGNGATDAAGALLLF